MDITRRQKVDELLIPRDIIVQILEDLPVKTLLRLRCVSKFLCSIIDDPYFIQIHHIRSHTRPVLLLRYEKHYQRSCSLYSEDPEGGPATYLLPLPNKDISIPFQSINGLVCNQDCIYNPSTREFKTLPPMSVVPCDLPVKYYLGFDPSTNKYKVLALCLSVHAQVRFKILTLGTNLWREIEIDTSGIDTLDMDYSRVYCITDLIYIISKSDSKDLIIAFEVGSEKFQIIGIPEGAKISSVIQMEEQTSSLIQVEEHLALIDLRASSIWILEDYEKQLWNRQSLILPFFGRVDGFIPVGTVHTGEILFPCHPSKLFYYNLKSKALRRAEVYKLTV